MSPHRGKPTERPANFSRGRCRRTGKLRWETRAAARAAARRLRAAGDPKAASLGTYHCTASCGDWHVGHRPEAAR